jgi:hypothetical protein
MVCTVHLFKYVERNKQRFSVLVEHIDFLAVDIADLEVSHLREPLSSSKFRFVPQSILLLALLHAESVLQDVGDRVDKRLGYLDIVFTFADLI